MSRKEWNELEDCCNGITDIRKYGNVDREWPEKSSTAEIGCHRSDGILYIPFLRIFI